MNWKHLYWIVPLSLIIGSLINGFFVKDEVDKINSIFTKYPIINCILLAEDSLNVDHSEISRFISPETQRRYLEKRCAEDYVDFNATMEAT